MQLRIDYLGMSYFVPSYAAGQLVRELAQKVDTCPMKVSVVPRGLEEPLPFDQIPVIRPSAARWPAASTA